MGSGAWLAAAFAAGVLAGAAVRWRVVAAMRRKLGEKDEALAKAFAADRRRNNPGGR